MRYDFTPASGPPVSGFITWSDAAFNGPSRVEALNTDITDMSLTFGGTTYTTANLNLDPGASVLFDDTGLVPVITGGLGVLTTDRLLVRDADPSAMTVTFGMGANAGVANAVLAQTTPVPLPASGLLLGAACLGVCARGRRRAAA